MTLQELIANSQLDKAIELLKESSTYQDDRQFQNQIIMISARLSRNRQQENMNLIPLDVAMRERNAIAHSLLGLADRYELSQPVENAPSVPDLTPQVDPKNLPEGAIKILFLASDPRSSGRLQIETELGTIHSSLSDSLAQFHLKPSPDTRPDTLMRSVIVEKPAIVHFCCHGVEAREGLHPEGILLQTRERDPKVMPAATLESTFNLIAQKIKLQVVVINACNSREQARAISKCGCYAVGMTKEIPDPAAIRFSSGFYLGLALDANDVPFAFQSGLNSLSVANSDYLSAGWKPHLFLNGEELTAGRV